jgi:hypothetical protein
MGTKSDGFPVEPEPFNLAALAGQEQLQERIRELENERAGKVRVALLSLAAELEAEADGLLAHRADSLMDRLTSPAAAECFRAAARMARLRATVAPDAAEHAPVGRQDKVSHAEARSDGLRPVQDRAP